ncbi:MAG TPA: hypothetical protein VHE35_21090, partial [Kofleriaceae bacterium]|nr:hypothetical protein [Kofleriaceae bacterium]
MGVRRAHRRRDQRDVRLGRLARRRQRDEAEAPAVLRLVEEERREAEAGLGPDLGEEVGVAGGDRVERALGADLVQVVAQEEVDRQVAALCHAAILPPSTDRSREG